MFYIFTLLSLQRCMANPPPSSWHVHMLTLHTGSCWPGRDPASTWWSTPYSLKWARAFIWYGSSLAGGRHLLAAYSHLLIWTGKKSDASLCWRQRTVCANMFLILFLSAHPTGTQLKLSPLLVKNVPVTFYITQIHIKDPLPLQQHRCHTSEWQHYSFKVTVFSFLFDINWRVSWFVTVWDDNKTSRYIFA